jgi:hypothetical protein
MTLNHTPKIAIITACSKRKLPYSAPAGEFYQGQFFKAVKKFAAAHQFDLYLISAKYGLISEHTIIEPYNIKLSGKKQIQYIRKIAEPIMTDLLCEYDRILILAGSTTSSVLNAFQTNPKMLWFFDNRGSGGFNQLITVLNTFPPNSVVRMIQSKLCTMDIHMIQEYQAPADVTEKKAPTIDKWMLTMEAEP